MSAEELDRPVPRSIWMVKGYVAHLATIDVTVRAWFEALLHPSAARASVASGERFDVDRWNEAEVAKRGDRPLEMILDEMHENRAGLEAVLERLTPAVLDGTMHFPGDRDRPPADVNVHLYLRGLAWHDPIHALDMLRALPDSAADPEVAAWLGPIMRT